MASRPDRSRFLLPSAAMFATAVLLYFGNSLEPVAALTWIAPVPVLLIAPRVAAWPAAGLAFGAYLLSEANVASYYLNSHDVPLPMGIAILVGTAALFACFVALFRTLFTRGRTLLAVIAAPALWTGALYLFSVTSPIGIMGTLMATQADFPVVLQIASLTGQWGVEYLVLLVPAAIAATAAPDVATAVRLRRAAALAVVCLAVLGFGAVRLAAADSTPAWKVALLVNDHAPWGSDVGNADGQAMLRSYLDQIGALPSDVDLIVFPEGGFAAHDDSLPTLTEALTPIARQRHAGIVVGLMLFTDGKKYNTNFVIPPEGDPVVYRRWNTAAEDSLTPGTALTFLPGDDRIGFESCGDVNFPDPTRAYAAAGARFMAVPASDEDVNGRQHATGGMLRGIENGTSIAWSGQRGTLLVADAHGCVLGEDRTDRTRKFVTVVADVPAGPGATLYTRTGEWFPWLCVVLAAAGLVVARRERETRGSAQHGLPRSPATTVPVTGRE